MRRSAHLQDATHLLGEAMAVVLSEAAVEHPHDRERVDVLQRHLTTVCVDVRGQVVEQGVVSDGCVHRCQELRPVDSMLEQTGGHLLEEGDPLEGRL